MYSELGGGGWRRRMHGEGGGLVCLGGSQHVYATERKRLHKLQQEKHVEKKIGAGRRDLYCSAVDVVLFCI